VTLKFNLLTSKLLCHLLLTWITSPESLNIVHCSISQLTVGAWHTNSQTDEQTDG